MAKVSSDRGPEETKTTIFQQQCKQPALTWLDNREAYDDQNAEEQARDQEQGWF